MKQYYFMAGLPRSGSTVLSAILNQNPRLYSGPSSPVLPTMLGIENQFLTGELYKGYPKPEQANLIISSIIHQFYSDVEKPIVIDKNRAWTDCIVKLEGYINKPAKIICPVRDIDEILTSMITMVRRNPYQEGQEKINFIDEQLVKLNIPLTDDNRCQFIAGPNGILGQSYTSIQTALESGFKDRIHFVEYKDLVSNPGETLFKLYEFLGEEYYELAKGSSNIQVKIKYLEDAIKYNPKHQAELDDIRKNIKATADLESQRHAVRELSQSQAAPGHLCDPIGGARGAVRRGERGPGVRPGA